MYIIWNVNKSAMHGYGPYSATLFISFRHQGPNRKVLDGERGWIATLTCNCWLIPNRQSDASVRELSSAISYLRLLTVSDVGLLVNYTEHRLIHERCVLSEGSSTLLCQWSMVTRKTSERDRQTDRQRQRDTDTERGTERLRRWVLFRADIKTMVEKDQNGP